jgi:hypothetical protein
MNTQHKKKGYSKGEPWIDRLILHYTHEKRLERYKRDVHQTWNEIFVNTPARHVKVIVGNQYRRNLKRELVHKRPNSILLGKKDTKSR